MQTVYVKPREGGRVRQPERASRVMPDKGDHVPRNMYYERLLISGDVVFCEPPSVAQAIQPDAEVERSQVTVRKGVTPGPTGLSYSAPEDGAAGVPETPEPQPVTPRVTSRS